MEESDKMSSQSGDYHMNESQVKKSMADIGLEQDMRYQSAQETGDHTSEDPWIGVRDFHRQDTIMLWAIGIAGIIGLIMAGSSLL